MKLNPDCVRDILFYLEEHLSISEDLEIEEIDIYELKRQLKYPIQELANTILVLGEAEFIEIVANSSDDCISSLNIYRITCSGYQFIESIRPESVWKKDKSINGNIGSFSINTITQIATGVITAMITNQLSGVTNL